MPRATELFEGLDPELVDEIISGSRQLAFTAGALLCEEGEPGDSILIIEQGAAEVLVGSGNSRVRHLRRGDVVGEISVISGEPRSATVRAIVPTDVVEVRREAITTAIGRAPQLLTNISRVLSRRLARAHVAHLPSGRGEAVGLVLCPSMLESTASLMSAVDGATPKPVTTVSVADNVRAAHMSSSEGAGRTIDDLLTTHGFVFVLAGDPGPEIRTLLAQLDRVVVIGTHAELHTYALALSSVVSIETIRLDNRAVSVARDGSAWTCPGSGDDTIAWIARHLTRTKLGLALGAGGAKGYAHVGVLSQLETAGFTVDHVAGSSIGAVVGACIAMGMHSAEIDEALRKRFSEEVVAAVFSLSFSGGSAGYDTMQELTRDLVGERCFDDLRIPFVAMTADLNSRLPAPISNGPLADALLAATALAGLFPPFERDGQRLVDGLALIPVPVDAVADSGADITVSVNLMSRDTLEAWPGEEPLPPQTGRQRMLETLLEVMDLTQLDVSVRHAAAADVTVTPRFGPCTWRDFHMADRFLAAGRDAAADAVNQLQKLATPHITQGDTYG